MNEPVNHVLNARKHEQYQKFMRWYRDEVTEDFILWMLEYMDEHQRIVSTMDVHDSIGIAKEQGRLESAKEIAYGSMFRRYFGERQEKLEREHERLALARDFDPQADWEQAGDSGDSREYV